MTTEALDYESTRAYTLTVTAQDQNGTVGSNVITRSATTSVSHWVYSDCKILIFVYFL